MSSHPVINLEWTFEQYQDYYGDDAEVQFNSDKDSMLTAIYQAQVNPVDGGGFSHMHIGDELAKELFVELQEAAAYAPDVESIEDDDEQYSALLYKLKEYVELLKWNRA